MPKSKRNSTVVKVRGLTCATCDGKYLKICVSQKFNLKKTAIDLLDSGQSQAEVGRLMGVTRQRINQIKRKMLDGVIRKTVKKT